MVHPLTFVEIDDNVRYQGIAGTDGGECLRKPWPIARSAGEAVIGIDPVGRHTELGESMALGRQILLVG